MANQWLYSAPSATSAVKTPDAIFQWFTSRGKNSHIKVRMIQIQAWQRKKIFGKLDRLQTGNQGLAAAGVGVAASGIVSAVRREQGISAR
jgi:hypothetical protein